MATRIILIDFRVPEHWEYAKRNGFWDLLTHWNGLAAGDTAYFKTTGSNGAFLGRARVTTEQEHLPPGTAHAWSPQDSRRGGYRFRIGLIDFEDIPVLRVSWAEIRAGASAPGRPNPVTLIPEPGDAWLEQRLGLGSLDPYEDALDALLQGSDDAELDLLIEDRRIRVPASVVIRRGRKGFRDSLLAAYEGRCAVTGTGTKAVLEAAHISDFRGDHTDLVANGLLLRADIHTLFDLKLLTIAAADMTIRVASEVRDDVYRRYDGQRIALPARDTDRPRAELLQRHNDACEWMRTREATDLARSSSG